MLDEVAPEILIIAGAVTVLVGGLMILVWLVSTREEKGKKKDEDKDVDGGKQAKKKRQHVSPRKKKEITIKTEMSTKDDDVEHPKSILKETKDEPSPRPHRVEFKKEVPKDVKATTRTNPPTPYPQPNTRVPSLNKETGNEESKTTKSISKEEKKQNQPSPPSKTTDQKTSKTKPATSTDGSPPQLEQQVSSKKKNKSKHPSTIEGITVIVIVKDS